MPPLSAPKQRFSPLSPAVLLIATLLLTPSCEPTVSVLNPSDQYRFSLFGALNVAAERQVIRVEPLGDSTQIGAPAEFNGTVVLKNLDSGTQVTLNDSLTTVGRRDAQVHNFWTTHPIQPATSYRVTVRSEGEAVTTATTTTPPRAPDLSHNDGFRLPCSFPRSGSSNELRPQNTFIVRTGNVERIASANVIYPITYQTNDGPLRTRNVYSHYRTIDENGDLFEISVFYRPDLANLNPDPPPGPRRECAGREEFTHPHALVSVAAGGPNWPEGWRGLPLDQIANPDAFSNVKGGHGYVAGVYSDTIRVPIQDRY